MEIKEKGNLPSVNTGGVLPSSSISNMLSVVLVSWLKVSLVIISFGESVLLTNSFFELLSFCTRLQAVSSSYKNT